MSSESKTWKVSLIDGTHYVVGLTSYYGVPNTMLLVRYPEGDCDTKMRDVEAMHTALYDLYNCHDAGVLKDGDVFATEFGEFVCSGVHVLRDGRC